MSSSFNPLVSRTRSWGRCWAAIWLSHHPEPSVHGVVDGLDSRGFVDHTLLLCSFKNSGTLHTTLVNDLNQLGLWSDSWVSERGQREWRSPLHFEIWHFSITFLAKKVVFSVSRSKDEISLLFPSLKYLYGYFQKIPLLAPLEKILLPPLAWFMQCYLQCCKNSISYQSTSLSSITFF